MTRIRSVSAIQFTQEQVRTLTGASVETVRHWRKAVPYLAEKSGKAARFSFSDVVALAITHELVRTFGVQIASVGIGIDSLFRLLSQRTTSCSMAVQYSSRKETPHCATLHNPFGTRLRLPVGLFPSDRLSQGSRAPSCLRSARTIAKLHSRFLRGSSGVAREPRALAARSASHRLLARRRTGAWSAAWRDGSTFASPQSRLRS